MAENSTNGSRITPRLIEDEMRQAYLEYSMSVIVGRALPDVRDGLKPVHRRALHAMNVRGWRHDKPFVKSAKVVGEVIGNYHPHGDSAAYETIVRMVQDFSLRYPLIQGQGNFGNIDGDSAAAYRYTEVRLNTLAEEALQDIDKETVAMVPNFDGTLQEPTVLPSKVPMLLINGSAGIAVGMATNIPPHNLRETCDAIMQAISNPDATNEELMQLLPAPDFPTGGLIIGTTGIRQAYTTGKGKITLRAKHVLEENKDRTRIIITEIPYQVSKGPLMEEIADLIRDKNVQGVSDLRDESDRKGIRIVIELKQGANSDVVLNQLFQHSRLQTTFGIINLALVGNEPKVLTLRELIRYYIDHRREVVRKRTQYELTEAQDKAHILEGIITALDHLDAVITLIKKSKSVEEARNGLMKGYKLSDKQANAILDTKLQKLTSLEQGKIRDEHKALLELISELKSILASEKKILSIITKELQQLKDKYGDERRTQVIEGEANIEDEALIKPEDVVVTVTHTGYVKRILLETYKAQNRGGKGIIGTATRDEDTVEKLYIANTRDTLLVFTNLGKVHWLKVHQLPEASRQARGTAIINLLQLEQGEQPQTIIPVKEFREDAYLFFVTRQGIVKRTALSEFSRPRRGGIIATGMDDKDKLVDVMLTDGKRQIIIATHEGMAIRFDENDARAMGRTAYGVIGIKLKESDYVIGAVVADEKETLLTVSEKGCGKRSPVEDYRLINRGGVGVINLNITDKTGNVVAIKNVRDDTELMLISKAGIIIRIPAGQVSVIGRNTQGVRVMKLDENDVVASVATIAETNATTPDNGNGR